jgi:hypothetical protein
VERNLGAAGNCGAYLIEIKLFFGKLTRSVTPWRLLQSVRKRDFDLRPRRRIFAMVQMAPVSRSRAFGGDQSS